MAKHYIIMSSSYIDGTRVALDITEDNMLNSTVIKAIIMLIKKHCGPDVPLSTHFIETESSSWESVATYDPFFDGVQRVRTPEEFAFKIQGSRVLSGRDVAVYILSKLKCTHLALEKLVYFAYADYLCFHSEQLFEDKIYAFTHGPVVKSVYETYKRSGYQYINNPLQFGTDSNAKSSVAESPARSRILFAKDGIAKVKSIDQTILKYGGCSAGDLVDLTHKTGSPWSHVDSSKSYQEISDDLIVKYHAIECL